MDFESHIQGSKPVLVEFYAEWSGPCKLLIPILHEVKETTGNRISVLRINISEDPSYAEDYHVYTVPTLILFRDGRIIWRKNGIASSHEILHNLDLVLASM
ncbi:MAG: thioredoxin family protein [Candidatus Dadabacteria bacterium]